MLGDYFFYYNDFNKMKDCYIGAIKSGNYLAKMKLFCFYSEKNGSKLITQNETILIQNIFKKKAAFVILLKSKYFHIEDECSVCLEDTNNIVRLPCHDEHIICLSCIYKLKSNICPFCRDVFPRNIKEFYAGGLK